MNKKFLSMFFVLLLSALLAIGTFAAEVYVKNGATGTGASETDALGTLTDAIAALDGKGGTIYLCDAVTETGDFTIPEQSGNLTITSAEGMAGSLVLDGTITFGKNENTSLFKFDMPLTTDSNGIVIYAGFNSVHFTEKFAVTGKVNYYGGVKAVTGSTGRTDEVDPAENLACNTDLPYAITVDNGIFGVFMGGNHRPVPSSIVGAVTADLTITINGGTFDKPVSYTHGSVVKNSYVFAVTGSNMFTGNATLTINGGMFNTPIYLHAYLGQTGSGASVSSALTYSDPKYYSASGEVLFDINGGTFTEKCIEISAEQTSPSYNRLHRGNFTLDISKDAVFEGATILDATQVKAYSGSDAKATLVYENAATLKAKRFDSITGTQAGNVTQTVNDEPIRIACIGDSITEGVGATNYVGYSYPAQLYKKAIAAGYDVIVSNYGSSSAKTLDYEGRMYNHGLAYTLSMYETDADYVIIGLGTNDARMTAHTYGMSDRFFAEYKALLEGYGNLPFTDTVFNTSAIYRRDYRDIITVSNIHPLQRRAAEELATEAKTAGKDVKYTFVDLYALTLAEGVAGNLLSSDNVHPDTDGYDIYATALLGAIFDGKTEVEGFKTTDLWVKQSGTNNMECTEANPTSNLAVALSRAADNATIHIIGDFNFARNENLSNSTGVENMRGAFSTPIGAKNLTIVGEGAGVTLSINTDQLFIKNDITFDNIALKSTAALSDETPLHISLGYNNVTFSEGFKTATPSGTVLVGGYVTHGDDPTSFFYNSRESVSSEKDCTITVNGGDWLCFLGGNYLFAEYTADGASNTRDSLYGTYSGNMTVNIGKNVTIADDLRSGAVGQNYLTGSVTMNVDAWEDGGVIREYAWFGDVPETAVYDAAKNTGTVKIALVETVNATVARPYDFDDNGKFDIADILQILKLYIRNSKNTAAYFPQHCDFADVQLLDALRLLQLYVQQ